MIANLPRLDPARPLGHACAMDALPHPLAFLVLVFAGWVNRQQQALIEYLLEENRILRVAHGSRRLRLTDDQRRRLAVKGKVLGRRRLAAIVTPDTILRWYRTLVAKKYDGSKARRLGRPSTKAAIAALVVRMANESDLGLHADPRRAQDPRPRRRPQHDQSNPQGSRHRAGTAARREYAVETFLAAHWDG